MHTLILQSHHYLLYCTTCMYFRKHLFLTHMYIKLYHTCISIVHVPLVQSCCEDGAADLASESCGASKTHPVKERETNITKWSTHRPENQCLPRPHPPHHDNGGGEVFPYEGDERLYGVKQSGGATRLEDDAIVGDKHATLTAGRASNRYMYIACATIVHCIYNNVPNCD